MANVENLKTAVEANTTATNAVVGKIGELGKPTQEELEALTTQIDANNTALNNAVAAE